MSVDCFCLLKLFVSYHNPLKTISISVLLDLGTGNVLLKVPLPKSNSWNHINSGQFKLYFGAFFDNKSPIMQWNILFPQFWDSICGLLSNEYNIYIENLPFLLLIWSWAVLPTVQLSFAFNFWTNLISIDWISCCALFCLRISLSLG